MLRILFHLIYESNLRKFIFSLFEAAKRGSFRFAEYGTKGTGPRSTEKNKNINDSYSDSRKVHPQILSLGSVSIVEEINNP